MNTVLTPATLVTPKAPVRLVLQREREGNQKAPVGVAQLQVEMAQWSGSADGLQLQQPSARR